MGGLFEGGEGGSKKIRKGGQLGQGVGALKLGVRLEPPYKL